MKEYPYQRSAAVAYALRWALSRNPKYYNFDPVGGDCTNFVSQCLYAGADQMNFTPVTGWYYRTSSDRTASWTGAQYLGEFLQNNTGKGPFARSALPGETEPGDVIQLLREDGTVYHSLFVTAVAPALLVSAHTYDAKNVPLSRYRSAGIRFLHICGTRK